MSIKIVAVFHRQKVLGMTDISPESAANPPMTVEGMEEILTIVPAIRNLGPFASMYSSRLARAGDAASVLAMRLDMDYATMRTLGKNVNRDCDTIRYYPGHEKDGYGAWQADGVEAFMKIRGKHESGAIVLAVSHRAIIGGVIAHCRGIHEITAIADIVNDPLIVGRGFRVFEVSDDHMRVLE